jgi:hypothetical protein
VPNRRFGNRDDFLSRRSKAWFAHIPHNETVYSAAARFHAAAGYNRAESSSQLLFGHTRGGSLIDLPVGLATLERATGGAIRADAQTLRNRTAFGPFLSLMSGERRAAYLAACCDSDLLSAKASAGLHWNLVATEYALRLCRQCAARQIARHGFAYWRADQQRPGVWLCREHGALLVHMPARSKKSRGWLPADRCLESRHLLDPPSLSEQDMKVLRRVADVVDWMAARTSIDVELMQIAVRERLVSAGYLRNEVSCSRAEYESLHEQFTKPLAVAGLPHFEGFRTGAWVRQVLIDRRTVHPLRWAVLLAAAGPTDVVGLDLSLTNAAARSVQSTLFGTGDARRRARAPNSVYQALTGPVQIADAARTSKIRLNELQRWLRRDPDLVEHWRATSFEVRHRAARLTIDGHRRMYPTALRSEVIKACLWAVRWLEIHDPDALDQALPRPVPMFDRQARLDLDE